MNGKKTSVFENGLIWFGAGVSLAEILTGTYFAPLGFGKGLLAILLGHVIGCVMLAPGRECQKLVRRDDLKLMKKGAVLVDIVIDQGGCFETSRPTTHDDPVYEVEGVLHYCVANIPGAVPRTSTEALVNATLPYGLRLAKLGLKEACRDDYCLRSGINTYDGKCTFAAVAEALDLPLVDPAEALGL